MWATFFDVSIWIELINYITIILHYLILKHNGNQALNNMCQIVSQNT